MTVVPAIAAASPSATKGLVYCPICTHTVEAQVVRGVRKHVVAPRQRCPRCSSQLDAGVVVVADLNKAA